MKRSKAGKPDLADLRQRFEELASRLGEQARPRARRPLPPPQALGEDYWQSVQDLFTRDVTAKGLRELLEREPQDTFRFFTREVDFSSLAGRPWYHRYPLAAWKVFLAMAHRLSPARRVLFAVAVPLLALGWLRYIVVTNKWSFPPTLTLATDLLAATVLFFLLVLELRDKLALKGDLEVARQIQFGLLPFAPYERDGVAIQASMRPANTVGGDYFDVIELEDGVIAVAVGDVAGKGMPAALLMALLQGSLRTLITAGFREAELVAKLNDHLHANIPSNRLITFFYAELQTADGGLHYINAGHNAPFLIRADGRIERLPSSGMALGVLSGARFESCQVRLGRGDRLFLFTDGVSEAFDPRECEYGEQRLESLLHAHRATPGADLIEAVITDVLTFCGSVSPRDDMTLMVVEAAPKDAPTWEGGLSG